LIDSFIFFSGDYVADGSVNSITSTKLENFTLLNFAVDPGIYSRKYLSAVGETY